jgi:hypothetical protein
LTVDDPAVRVVSVKAVENLAVQLRAADMVRLPSLQSESPLQLVNVEPLAAVPVSVTVTPVVKYALHVDPQSIPDGLVVTVPEPDPVFVIVIV